MQPIIVALSGKKQSGKGTLFRLIRDLNELGTGRPVEEFLYADKLKQMAVEILGVPEEWAWGDDAAKRNKVEHLLWENFPVPVFDGDDGKAYVGRIEARLDSDWSIDLTYAVDRPPNSRPKAGPMTVREVLQYYGTEVFRRHYGNVWADACLRQIRYSDTFADGGVCVITDCRFPNEVDAARGAGGFVVRLTRNAFDDRHASEVALDPDAYDWSNFDAILRNDGLGVRETLEQAYDVFVTLGVVPRTPRAFLDPILDEVGR